MSEIHGLVRAFPVLLIDPKVLIQIYKISTGPTRKYLKKHVNRSPNGGVNDVLTQKIGTH